MDREDLRKPNLGSAGLPGVCRNRVSVGESGLFRVNASDAHSSHPNISGKLHERLLKEIHILDRWWIPMEACNLMLIQLG